MKRKVKRHYWWPAVIGVVTVGVLAMPVDMYIRFIFETRQKVEVTEQLIKDLTLAAEAGVLLVGAVTALIAYKVIKK